MSVKEQRMSISAEKRMSTTDRETVACYINNVAPAHILNESILFGYELGFEAGRLAGVEEGMKSAAILVAGLRQLLGIIDEKTEPAGIFSIAAAENGPIKIEDFPEIPALKPFEPVFAKEIIRATAPEEKLGPVDETIILNTSTGEIQADPEALAAELGESRFVIDPNGDLPRATVASGFKALDRPLCDCDLCGGLGVVEGELYGEPALVPCICKAGTVVYSQADPSAMAGLPRQASESLDQIEREIEDVPEVKEPAAVDAVEEFAQVIEEAEQQAAATVEPHRCDVCRASHPHCSLCCQTCAKKCNSAQVCTFEKGKRPGDAPAGDNLASKVKEDTAKREAVICFNQDCGSYDLEFSNHCKNTTNAGICKSAILEAPAAAPGIADENDGVDVGVCFRLNCKQFNANEANGCKEWEHVFECPHMLGPDAVVCANLGCSSFESGKPSNCAAIADMMVSTGKREPATSCTKFQKAPDLAGTFDPEAAKTAPASDLPECCQKCPVDDPDCSSCTLPDQAQDEQGGLSRGTSQVDAGDGMGAAELSPEELKKKALQEKCPHPKPFIEVIPGRGEVCTVCDRVLTPESLPLFPEKEDPAAAPGAKDEVPFDVDPGTYFAAGDEPGDPVCDHLPEDVRYIEDGKTICGLCGEVVEEKPAVKKPDCTHPIDVRHPSPEFKDGEKVGTKIECGNCGEIVARFDLERKPIPRELWPENATRSTPEAGSGQAPTVDELKAVKKYRPSEIKILRAGFQLARFERPDKENIRLYATCLDPRLGWYLVGHYKKFVDGERALAELLEKPTVVQVNNLGEPADGKATDRLAAAGFEFYRYEKAAPGVTPKIKMRSKNWGMHSKYKDDTELGLAYKKLMNEDEKALNG